MPDTRRPAPAAPNVHAGTHGFRGIVPPMVTPMLPDGEIDEEAIGRLVQFVTDGGVRAVFALGTCGEAPSLSQAQRRVVVRATRAAAGGSIPVWVGATDTSRVETLALARYAADQGANAVVLTTPYYFPMGQGELLSFFERLLPEIPLQVLLYNIPQMTKVEFAPETVRQLALEHPKILGIKDSSGSMEYFRQLIAIKAQRPDWTVLVGPELLLLESLEAGGDGGVNGGAVFWPQLFAELLAAFDRGDMAEALRLNEKVKRLSEVYALTPEASSVIKGVKSMCRLRGLCSDIVAEPFTAFGDVELSRLREIGRAAGMNV